MFPENIDIKPTDLFYTVPMALVFIIAKFTFRKTVLFLLETCQTINFVASNGPSRNKFLETSCSKRLNQKDNTNLSEQCEIIEEDVNRGHSEFLNDFIGNICQYLYYIFIFTYGIAVLWKKPWLWDLSRCFEDFDHQQTSADIWWYYMVPQAFYVSNFLSHIFDVRRKHYYFIFFHHVITVLILTLSWIYRFVRIAAVGMMVHDISNVFLEASKIAFALKKQTAHTCIFAVFSFVWIMTRMGVFPLWIIRNCLSVQLEIGSGHYGSLLLSSLLLILFGLHCFSTCMIIKMFNIVGKLFDAETEV